MANYDRLWHMMQMQRELQVALDQRCVGTLDEQVAYFKDMILACTDELHEALAETGWKPWATTRFINRDAAFSELRDAWQFLTNAMMVVTGDTPEEMAARLHVELARKVAVNWERYQSGTYDGRIGKCEMCKRDLEEVDTTERVHDGIVDIICVCGALVATRPV